MFRRSGGTWTQEGPKLTPSGAVGPSQFGWSVALSWDGSTAVIGAPADDGFAGAAYVFARSGSTWTQLGSKLTATGEVVRPRSFGDSVALSGDGATALIGAHGDHGSVGAAWVFARSGRTWTQQGLKLDCESGRASPAIFGISVALSSDGTTALIGAPLDDGSVGTAWVFARSGSGWTQQGSKLTAPDESSVGQGLFGWSVALVCSTAARRSSAETGTTTGGAGARVGVRSLGRHLVARRGRSSPRATRPAQGSSAAAWRCPVTGARR